MLPAVLVGFTVHEFSHAYFATKLGDNTPKIQGRLTLNPLAHLELIGFLMIILAGFGWAKPVEFNPGNFKNPKNDEILVSVAGPLSNFLTAIVIAVLLKILVTFAIGIFYLETVGEILYKIFTYLIWINLLLAIFNLFPIPPLDGSHILLCLIPDKFEYHKNLYRRYGSFILIALILFGNYSKYNILPIGYLTQRVYSGLLNALGM